jgi:Zn-dependent membrane protease YugP
VHRKTKKEFFMFFPMVFDPTYIILIPALILGIWAQYKVHSTFTHYSQFTTASGKTAAQVAREILDANGLQNVPIEHVAGELSDHFDPKTNTVRLSDSVHNSKSISAIGVAAHEVGHAIQHAVGYAPITIRNTLVPVVSIASYSWFIILLAGFFLHNMLLVKIGIIAFGLIALFQLVTLPVEFDASKRALVTLKNHYFTPTEYEGARKVLTAAGMTYVAALVSSLSQLLRLVLLFSNSNNRD